MEMKNIRNFCIIAHIDHGKSTLADRLLELTDTLGARDMENQVLDDMDLEKEKGITIKSHAIQMVYRRDGQQYRLNLIDTPGHVDFSYEVSRSIASCEGALLVVDASQGVQAQTISNLYMAIDHGLEIIPVLNKIDMDSAQVDVVTDEVCDLLGCSPEDVFKVSARTGEGVAPILDAIVDRIPAPEGDPGAPLQALIFDSVFNSFRGVIAYVKIKNGSIRKGDRVKFFATGKEDMERFSHNGADLHSRYGDPMFLNADKGDYRTEKASPARSIGFQDFPTDEFGVRDTRLRQIARRPALPDLQTTRKTENTASPTSRVWLGAHITEAKGSGLSAFGVGFDKKGIAFGQMEEKAPAAKWGLKSGDLLQSINGIRITGFNDLQDYIERLKGENKTQELSIIRKQETVTVRIPASVLRAR